MSVAMSVFVARVLDANLNRAREAMRVMEDYARFGLNDDTLCAALKGLRHDLAGATAGLAAHALLFRDTPGDVGTAIATPAEYQRPGVAAVVTAAGKRLGEALRTIEEYAKIDPSAPPLRRSAAGRAPESSAPDPAGFAHAAEGILPDPAGVAPAADGLAPAAQSITPAPPGFAPAGFALAGFALAGFTPADVAPADLARPAVGIAPAIEALRYRFYDIEKALALTLIGGSGRFAGVRLYVLITAELVPGGDWLAAASAALDGGADCLQLREKQLDGRALLARAAALVALCRARGRLCVINDRVDVALACDADGVHLGQDDLPPRVARQLLGPHRLIGVSTHAIAQAQQAVRDGADYIGVGPVFPSRTKPRDITPGLAYARQVAELISIPAVAIAGITPENVAQVRATGLQSIAVTASVLGAPDITTAARTLRAAITGQV